MICRKCGKKQSKIKRFLWLTFLLYLGITSIIGTLGLYNIITHDVNDGYDSDKEDKLSGLAAPILNIKLLFQGENKVLENYAKDITKECETDNCKAKKIYLDLVKNWDYELGEEIDEMKIFYDREGDCDEMTNLYISILKTINIKARASCSITHCWSVVYLDDQKIKADITKRVWEKYETS